MKRITFDCPECGKPLNVPETAASDTGPCPYCKVTITGPGIREETRTGPDAAPAVRSGDGPEEPAERPVSGIPDPRPPEPWETATPPFPVKDRPRRPRGATIFVLFILTALLCLFIGYQLGRNAAQLPEHQQAAVGPMPRASAPPAPPEPDDDETEPEPVELAPRPEVPSAAEPAALSPAREALIAFLNAPDWASRSVHVLNTTGPLLLQMETLASKHGDGPIASTEINDLHLARDRAVFELKTSDHPEGFPVILMPSNGRWLVDWPGFADFHYDLFRSLAREGNRGSGIFRLLVKPVTENNDSDGYHSCPVAPPDGKNHVPVLVKTESPAHNDIVNLFSTLSAQAPRQLEEMMGEGGLPLTLAISTITVDGKPRLVIDQMIARGWNPLSRGQAHRNNP